MKKQLLLIIAACFTCVAAFAQWTEPEIPTTASAFQEGHLYRLRNAEPAASGEYGYMAGGSSWFTWATSTVLVFDLEQYEPITFSIEMGYDEDGEEVGYTFYNVDWESQSQLGPLTYVSALGDEGLGQMHMDGYTTYTAIYFNITETATANVYQISIVSSDADYGEYADKCWGYIPDSDYSTAVYAFLDPADGNNKCTWEFVDMTDYTARMALYEALEETLAYPDIDADVVAEASALLADSSATVEQLEAEVLAVEAAIKDAATKGASEDNPNDVTILIENPDFETGNIDGWDCTFEKGVSATNVGFQAGGDGYYNTSSTYVNHEGEEVNPFCKNFIEAWEPSASYGAEDVASIGDAELSQTMESLPAGKYKLSCDAIAVQQNDASSNPVKGVQLFAKGGTKDNYTTIANPSMTDQAPYHYDLIFFSTGGDVTLGLRTVSTNANWIAADNFEMLYYGSDYDIYLESLKLVIEQFKAEYPDMDELIANNDVKAAFSSTIEAAESAVAAASSTDDEYDALELAIRAAADDLSTSISEYAEAKEYMDYIQKTMAQAEANGHWDELAGEIADYYDAVSNKYSAGTLTSEEIAQMQEDIPEMIADYLSTEGNIQDGDDISILIRNTDFDKDFSGWTYNVKPNWGGDGSAGGGENTLEGKPTMAEIASGNAEYFATAFDINQTIKSMPVGLYKLTLQVFERDDANDGIDAELYAAVDGVDVNSELVTDIMRDAQEDPQYSVGGDWGAWPNDTYTDGYGYTPNSMAGANVYFYEGFYTTTFNILITKRGDLTIGLRKANATDWVLFDTFKLVYEGNSANAYADYIDELIAQADQYASPAISNEVDKMIVDAIDAGDDAIDRNDADACLAAIEGLQAAIAAAEASAALVIEIEELYNYTNDVRMAEAPDVDFTNLLDVLDTVGKALDDGFETDAQIEELMEAINTTFNADVLAEATNATEEAPVDVTPVIITASCVDNDGEASYYGWTPNDGTVVGTGSGCCEIFEGNGNDAGAGIEQVLYNLSAGYYILGVQGFYRPTGWTTTVTVADVEEGDTLHYVDLYAGGASSASSGVAGRRKANSTNAHTATRLLSIYADAEKYNDADPATTADTYTVPAAMETAETAFLELDLYHNYLQFEVATDGTDVPIGIVKTGDGATDDWTIFTNWTLQYIGTEDPVNDPTTAIESVDGSGDVVAKAIYSVNGVRQSRLTKGINIVKSTLSDGTVEVTKILVK